MYKTNIELEIKSIENLVNTQERIIETLKDIIQDLENEKARLWHENRALKARLFK